MTEWSDEQVSAATDDAGLSTAEDRQISELLHRQQAGILTNAQHRQLAVLMEAYQNQLLRKARALREAVRRGLRPPLPP